MELDMIFQKQGEGRVTVVVASGAFSASDFSPKCENACWAQLEHTCEVCPMYVLLERLLRDHPAQRSGAWSDFWVFGCAPKYCHRSFTGGNNAVRIFSSFRGRKEGGCGLHHFRRCGDMLKVSLFRDLVRLDFSGQGACPWTGCG